MINALLEFLFSGASAKDSTILTASTASRGSGEQVARTFSKDREVTNKGNNDIKDQTTDDLTTASDEPTTTETTTIGSGPGSGSDSEDRKGVRTFTVNPAPILGRES